MRRLVSADLFTGVPRWLRIGVLLFVLSVIAGCWQQDIGRSYYPSGKLKTEATVRNGLLNGPAMMYYESGAKMSEATYRAGLLDGSATSFYENGAKKAVAEYKDGYLNGLSIGWSKDGIKQSEVFFSEGIVKHAQGCKG